MTVVVVLALAGMAVAAARVTLHKTKTVKLPNGKTKLVKVRFPDALKFKGSKYSGKVTILTPGPKPASKAKIKILSKGKCVGGSTYCVKVKNNNVKRSPAKVKVTATTVLPKGKKK